MIFIDWDVWPVKPIPDDLWDRLGAKDPLQALLQHYRRRKIFWRPTDSRKTLSGGFVYIRDPAIPRKLLEISDEHPTFSEEVVMAYYVDRVLGHWPNVPDETISVRACYEKHEPYCCVHRKSPLVVLKGFTPDKDIIFRGPT